MQEGPVLLQGLLTQNPCDHLQAGLTKLANATPINTRIRILKTDDDATNAGTNHRLATGGRSAVMAAGFQGHHKRSTTRRIPGLFQSTHFRMGLATAGVKPLSHKVPIAIQNHSPDEGVGTGVTFSEGSKGQRPTHPELPHQLRGNSCSERHSPTT